MKLSIFSKLKINVSFQYFLTFLFVSIATVINFGLEPLMGYWGLGLIYLLAIVIQSLVTSRGPIFLSAFSGACLWNLLFIPPKYTFRIHNPEDILLVIVYLVVALVTGTLSASISRGKVLEESERLHKLLLNSLSHELRTPISTIQGAVSNLQSETIAQDPLIRAQLISEIQIANDRLNRLIQNLLDMSRLESGHLKPRFEWCDLSDIISTTLGHFKERFPNQDISIQIQNGTPLVFVDYVLLEQVLLNLLYNSVVHSKQFSKIKISVSFNEQRVLIQVQDNGPGIDPKILPFVFDKFVRGEKAEVGGIGLGLALAKGFVEIQNGQISLYNLQGGGISVELSLPILPLPNFPSEIPK